MLALRSPAAGRRQRTRKSVYHMRKATPHKELIGLDVLREYGLVIDYHFNRVYSHILKRYVLVQFFQQDILHWKYSTQWRVMPSRLDTGAYIQEHRRKERLHLSHPYFIFMTRSQNTSTDTLLRAKTIFHVILETSVGEWCCANHDR